MIENKKIMMLATTDNMIGQFLLPHIKYLQEHGNVVECVCAKTGFWFDELKSKYGLKVHEIGFKRSPFTPANFKGYRKLVKLQKQEKFDLIYCQQPVGGLMGRLLARKFKLPCIYTAHGFHFFKGNSKLKNFLFKTVEKFLARYTDILITINQEDYDACKNWKAKHVFKINGIGFDNNKYLGEKLNREESRQVLGLKDEFTILTVAEFIKRKNYETMLETIAKLKEENIKFLICGSGRDEDEIRTKIKELNIQDKVELLGYRKDIDNIMRASDIFFLPSYQEGLTLSIIEALNFGLPIVTSNVRGNRDLVQNNINGFVCDVNDSDSFAKNIKMLINDKELQQRISSINLKDAEQYSINAVLKQLEEIYSFLVEEKNL